jgi:hypothetical protein
MLFVVWSTFSHRRRILCRLIAVFRQLVSFVLCRPVFSIFYKSMHVFDKLLFWGSWDQTLILWCFDDRTFLVLHFIIGFPHLNLVSMLQYLRKLCCTVSWAVLSLYDHSTPRIKADCGFRTLDCRLQFFHPVSAADLTDGC